MLPFSVRKLYVKGRLSPKMMPPKILLFTSHNKDYVTFGISIRVKRRFYAYCILKARIFNPKMYAV